MKLLSPDEPIVLTVTGTWRDREVCGVHTEDGSYRLPAYLYGWVEMCEELERQDPDYWPDVVAFGKRNEPWAEFLLGRTLEEVLDGKAPKV